MKSKKVALTVSDYIDLGGSLESLVGRDVIDNPKYTSYSYYKITEIKRREIKKGKKKGQQEVSIVAEYKQNSLYKRIYKSFSKLYILVDITLVQSDIKALSEVTDHLEKIQKMAQELKIDEIKLKYSRNE